jgi:serine/threonine protein kinase
MSTAVHQLSTGIWSHLTYFWIQISMPRCDYIFYFWSTKIVLLTITHTTWWKRRTIHWSFVGVQISDFGLAVSSGNRSKGNLKLSGTLGYVAPEYLLDGMSPFSSSYPSSATYCLHLTLFTAMMSYSYYVQLYSIQGSWQRRAMYMRSE